MKPLHLSSLFQTLLVTDKNTSPPKGRHIIYNTLCRGLLKLMAVLFNHRPALNHYLKGADGWINFTVGFITESGGVCQAARFRNGRMAVLSEIPEDADVVIRFADEAALMEMLRVTPNEVLNLILKNRMILDGNLAYLQLFNYLVSLLMGKKHQKMLEKAHKQDTAYRQSTYDQKNPDLAHTLTARRDYRMTGEKSDPNVRYLADPYLSAYRLDDFPRLKDFLDRYFNNMPEICPERPQILTQWFRENGFENQADNTPWIAELRQAQAFAHLMAQKKPVIRPNDLVAGTTTTNANIGVVIYPEAQGVMAWGELSSIDKRILNPYRISEETIRILHHDVFPFWADRNFREWVRKANNYPICQKIEERWVAYFVWKSVGISHTIPHFPTILEKGTSGIIADIETRIADPDTAGRRAHTLQAMKIAIQGLDAYAARLAETASKQADKETEATRRKELQHLCETLKKVPREPAETLDEAVQVLNLVWIAIHMENANTGMSFGRLDQWLQPYFENDMAKLETAEAKSAYIRHAIELIGCLFFRFSDHLPLSPDIGNYLFGGASATQALTIGGVTRNGRDGVNDMTYIILKVTEMLGLRDVNVNARVHPEINTSNFLRRLCEVNFITAGTPSLHNDPAVFKSLAPQGYPIEDIRDWSATGCVEPTISGRHMGHTGSILFNLVAPLEMALHNGAHPLMNWAPGPATGSIEAGDFPDFDAFFNAFERQLRFLIGNAVEYNNMLARVHAEYRPTPFLSALMEGAVASATDVTRGGAMYNSSGTSNIGLSDVVDSLMVIKKMVFEEKKIPLTHMKTAIDTDFTDDPELHALIAKQAPRFGSGDPEALEMARRVTRLIHDIHAGHKNFRGGAYTTGFWSMSQHVAYGTLSGALPSARRFGKAFTPGLTPNPMASTNFLDNLRDVARLDAKTMDNNIAFNVKLNPNPLDSREKTVDIMRSYVNTYFDMGGMQLQFNVVNSQTLKDAMAHPEAYRHLMVRISGYNAYFVMLNTDIQLELIERAEYGL